MQLRQKTEEVFCYHALQMLASVILFIFSCSYAYGSEIEITSTNCPVRIQYSCQLQLEALPKVYTDFQCVQYEKLIKANEGLKNGKNIIDSCKKAIAQVRSRETIKALTYSGEYFGTPQSSLWLDNSSRERGKDYKYFHAFTGSTYATGNPEALFPEYQTNKGYRVEIGSLGDNFEQKVPFLGFVMPGKELFKQDITFNKINDLYTAIVKLGSNDREAEILIDPQNRMRKLSFYYLSKSKRVMKWADYEYSNHKTEGSFVFPTVINAKIYVPNPNTGEGILDRQIVYTVVDEKFKSFDPQILSMEHPKLGTSVRDIRMQYSLGKNDSSGRMYDYTNSDKSISEISAKKMREDKKVIDKQRQELIYKSFIVLLSLIIATTGILIIVHNLRNRLKHK